MKWLKRINIIAGVVFILSSTLPFSRLLSEDMEDILFFRGVTISVLLFLISGAVANRKDIDHLFNIIAIAGGVLSLLMISTVRLFFTFNTKWYFYVPIGVVIICLIVLKGIKLWYKARYLLRKYSK